jgi:plasmid stability protein
MATITLKNVPDDLYARLKERAARSRRSINREAIVCLEQALPNVEVDREALLARIRARREAMTGIYITEEELNVAKRKGRM